VETARFDEAVRVEAGILQPEIVGKAVCKVLDVLAFVIVSRPSLSVIVDDACECVEVLS
tara:strand:- start:378 stop:554 length:177 start_codon:yes stop_codon:yes gene_type:complete